MEKNREYLIEYIMQSKINSRSARNKERTNFLKVLWNIVITMPINKERGSFSPFITCR